MHYPICRKKNNDLKFLQYFLFLSLIGFVLFSEPYAAFAFGLTISIAFRIILTATVSFVFREWALLLYSVNYLLSPAITYQLEAEKLSVPMKISSDYYFSLAFPGFILLYLGMFLFRTKIFKPNFNSISKITLINERFLVQLTLFGVVCDLLMDFLPSDLAFLIYLLSLLRFVGIFSLFASNSKKYWLLALLILGFELFHGFKTALFHDSIMWLIFFGLFYLYVSKPNLVVRLIGAFTLIVLVLLIQAFKSSYRERVWEGGESATIATIGDVGLEKANTEDLAGEENLLGTLNRGNQAWIFASTVDHLDRTNDFQGLNNVYLYLEAALLPRFLAPNKIKSGDKVIFNKFSGHYIGSGTSMGLGIFADGYIGYGRWGVYVFTFILGLMFSLVFRLVQNWSQLSPFYALLILPILNYAVRPDCELQTILNHLLKSVVVYGGLVNLTKYRFALS